MRSWKPEPEGLIRIRDFFNIKEENMIYFGDLEKDMIAGSRAGIESHYVTDLISLVKNVRN